MKYQPRWRGSTSPASWIVTTRRSRRQVGGGGARRCPDWIAYILFNVFTGGRLRAAFLAISETGQSANNTQLASECKTGQDANEKLDCAVVADIDSIQRYWATTLPSLGGAVHLRSDGVVHERHPDGLRIGQ